MSGKKGRRRPWRVNRVAAFAVLQRASVLQDTAPLPKAKREIELLRLHQSIASLLRGKAELIDMVRIAHAANLSRLLCDQGIGAEYTAELEAAMLHFKALDERAQANGGRWVCTGEQMEAIRWIAELHDAQINSPEATMAMLSQVEDEVMKRTTKMAAENEREREHADAEHG